MKKFFLLPVSILLFQILYAQVNSNNESLWFSSPANHWLEALPLGNGSLGAMIFSNPGSEHIQFNESSLITGDDKYVGNYQSFGDIFLSGKTDAVTSYKRQLFFEDGIHMLKFKSGGTVFTRECFVSHSDGVFVMMITSDKSHAITTEVQMKDARPNHSKVLKNLISFNGELINRLKYAASLKIKSTGGGVTVTDSSIQIHHADTLVLYMTAATNLKMSPTNDFLGADPRYKVDSVFKNLHKYTYAQLKSRHVSDFRNLYTRVRLNLGPTINLPSNERLDAYVKGSNDHALVALLFQYGRYLLISSSRKGGLPANLQGIWNNESKPAWYSQYTTNINLEMNYWLAEQTNLSECHFPMFDWVENLAKKNRGTKDSVLTVEKGWVAFSTNNILGGSSRWHLHRPGSAWLSKHFWDHYEYTGDKKFLTDRTYPLLKELVEYWESHLIKRPDGKLITPDGWSPEHGPYKNEKDVSEYPGTSYDQQIVYDLFTNYIDAENIVRKDLEYRKRATKLRDNLLGPQIGKWGQLQEWMDDLDDSTDHHRHSSHLFAVYPGKQINPSLDKKFADAASKSLDARGNISTGWSAAWRMNIRARLLQPEKAHDLIKVLLRPARVDMRYYEGSGVYPNFFDAHPPFQIDGNFGFTAGVSEMLLQSYAGKIHLLPAIPVSWKTGAVSGLKARGNLEIGISWKNGILEQCNIKPEFTGDYLIQYHEKVVKVHLLAHTTYRLNNQLQIL